MSRHSRDRAESCPTRVRAAMPLAAVAFLILFTLGAAEPQAPAAALTELQRLAAARGAEALASAEGVSRTLWTGFDPEKLSLMIVEPGRWAVLINHPKPPAGFTAAQPVPRRRLAEEDQERPPWSVHVSTETAPWEDPP